MIKKILLVVMYMLGTLGFITNGWCDWQRADLGLAGGAILKLDIGNGRNDGRIRIYAGNATIDTTTVTIYEYSYVDGKWSNESIGDVKGSFETIIAAGRNDGVMRVYSADGSQAPNESSYQSDDWAIRAVGDSSPTYGLTIGTARNDGVIRIYKYSMDAISELTYENGIWSPLEVCNEVGTIRSLNIGTGRNDSVMRLFALNEGSLNELTYSDSKWNKIEIDNTGGVDLCIGKLRDDNSTRIYAGYTNAHIYEFTYSDGTWNKLDIGKVSENNWPTMRFVIGPGRNDGKNRLYIVKSDNVVHELSYEEDTWKMSEIFRDVDTEARIYAVAIGAGRNDKVMRVYTGCDDGHVYEYTWVEPTPTPTASPTPTPDPADQSNPANMTGQIIDSDFVYAAPNPIRGTQAKIHVYCKQPARVTIMIFTMLNKQVLKIEKEYPAGDNVENIDMSKLANGTYLVFVKARNDQGVVEKVTSKIVLIK